MSAHTTPSALAATQRTAWLAHDLFFTGLPCKGGPGKPTECDLDAPCFRHGNLFTSAERLVRLRARGRA